VDMDDPQWRLKESNRNQIADGDALLNIGLPEARRFLADSICRIIEESGIDCYREDFNIAPLAFWRAADAPDRQGITEIRWVEGLYAFWDELRARNPGLVIDNCASGGRRIDLETLGRAIPFWRTDFPSDALAAQCQAQGLLPWVPLHSVGPARIGVDDPYRFRSMMGSSLLAAFEVKGDGPDLDPIPDSYPFDLARRNLEDYRKIQHFYYGDYYPLTDYSPCDDAWMAYQLDRPDLGEGLIAVFKRPRSPFVSASFRLHGLDEAATYEVIDLDTGETVSAAGAALVADGLTVTLAGGPDASLLRYRCAGRKE
jgi:alpha-galactosidase